MKLDLMVFAAHPDDAELSCAGTIIKHVEAGYKAGVVDITRGELGTRGNAELRAKEAEAAAKIMGIAMRDNLELPDGFFEVNEDNKMAVVHIIRKYQPTVIIANAIHDRHPDHGRASKLVSDACFLSGLLKIKTLMDGEEQQPWRPKAVYHYIQDRYMKPDFIVDISDQMEKRIKAFSAFTSQLYDADSQEPETAISSKQFFDSLNARALEFGRMIGRPYGEGFVAERIPGVTDIFNLL